MGQTLSKQARSRLRISKAREQRDIAIYQSHMAGNSVRTIQDEFAIKSTQTVHAAISRGKELVKERGIDLEDRRIEIDQLFANTLGHLAGEIQRQADEGRIQTIERSDGSREIRRTKGIDPRTAEALARSSDRWAQFLGITDRANEVQQQATVIQLGTPSDGASFSDKWSANSESQIVDVNAMSTDLKRPAQIPAESGMSHSLRADDSAVSAPSQPELF
ncbi:MAG: Uncharacterised protein [Synechococcus sp. MIT S9220]|nr:MAG: Uncharacterised protein [Synechococcus sp. MIT S9220]